MQQVTPPSKSIINVEINPASSPCSCTIAIKFMTLCSDGSLQASNQSHILPRIHVTEHCLTRLQPSATITTTTTTCMHQSPQQPTRCIARQQHTQVCLVAAHPPAPSPCSCTMAFSSRRFIVISSCPSTLSNSFPSGHVMGQKAHIRPRTSGAHAAPIATPCLHRQQGLHSAQ
jgi:hypothetical protein